ncbi:MAG: hypothetical protein ACP5O6_00850 [Candidatus Baltobacteraceae bacterium]
MSTIEKNRARSFVAFPRSEFRPFTACARPIGSLLYAPISDLLFVSAAALWNVPDRPLERAILDSGAVAERNRES